MSTTRARSSAIVTGRSTLSYVPPRFRKRKNDDQRLRTTSHINSEFSARSTGKIKTPRKTAAEITPLDLHSVVFPPEEENVEDRDIPIDEVLDQEGEDESGDTKIFLTFDLLKSMTPKNCIKYLSSTPIFLRTLFLEGSLDQDIISSVALSLTQSELQKFMLNMTQEVNFFTAIQTCKTIAEFEEHIPKLITMQRATVWTKMDNADFLTSSSLKAVLPLRQSVVGVPFLKKDDYMTADPGNFENFSITYDLPLLRGINSMLLLPITTPSDEVVAVFQCVGLRNPVTDEPIEFNDYYFETFKIVRDLIQKRFFSIPSQRVLPSTVSSIFSEVESGSIAHTARQIENFFVHTIPCEQCDLFEFDDRYRCLIRLTTDERYGEVDGGVSFAAGVSSAPINIPHGQTHPAFAKQTDGKYINRSLLSKSLQQGRVHYVITLRAKPNSPSFSNADSRMVSEMSPLIIDALKLAKYMQEQSNKIKQAEHERDLFSAAVETISAIASSGTNCFKALEDTAKNLFGCDQLFICIFDGRYMRYFPSEVKCKFEDCAAGQSYNYRETVWTRADELSPKYSDSLYKELNVDRKISICFPYRSNGRVVGAIEIINPSRNEIDKEEERIFGNMCGTIVHDYFNSKIHPK